MTTPHHWHLRAMLLPLNLSWIYPVPIPPMTRARSKIRVAETWTETSPIGQSAGAVTRPTTLTWNALHPDAIHLVKCFLLKKKKREKNIRIKFHVVYQYIKSISLYLNRPSYRKTWTSFCCIGLPALPQPLCWWMQGGSQAGNADSWAQWGTGFISEIDMLTRLLAVIGLLYFVAIIKYLVILGESYQSWETRGGDESPGRNKLAPCHPSPGRLSFNYFISLYCQPGKIGVTW